MVLEKGMSIPGPTSDALLKKNVIKGYFNLIHPRRNQEI